MSARELDSPTLTLPAGVETVGADLPGSPPEEAPAAPPDLPPGYVLLRELGRGGGGVVYLAHELALNRPVALKVLLDGEHATGRAAARFLAEGEAVARLQHPHVVQVHAVGRHAGRPYMVLEFCPGGSLAEELRDRPPDARRAAGLVEKLARGVAAAHAAGVVHRDLKPSNVLLDAQGEPKVTDFGIARLGAGGLTASEAALGTPSYMSPEQALGQARRVGPWSDVYSLGATLYECLTGRPPFLAESVPAMMQMVAAEEPLRPRRLRVGVPRDLETVCLKCLEKDPARRYATAAALADDLRASLEGRPVQARPAGPLSRAAKWVRRHLAVSALALAVVLSLLAGLAGVYSQYLVAADAALAEGREAERARDAEARAEVEAERSRGLAGREKAAREQSEKRAAQLQKSTDVLASMFDDLNPYAAGTDKPTLREQLAQRLVKVEAELTGESAGDALSVARLQFKLGQSLRGLGEYERAAALCGRSADAFEALLGSDHEETLTARHQLAHASAQLGRLSEAAELHESVALAVTRKHGEGHPKTEALQHCLAEAYSRVGRHDEAVRLLENLVRGRQARLEPDHAELLHSRDRLGHLYLDMRRYAEAARLLADVARLRRVRLGPDHLDTLQSQSVLSLAYSGLGRHREAAGLQEAVLRGRQSRLGPDHPGTLTSSHNLGYIYTVLGRYAAAAPLLEAALRGREARLGTDHSLTQQSRLQLAYSYGELRRHADAARLYEACLRHGEVKAGPDDPDTLDAGHRLAWQYSESGRQSEAIRLYEQIRPRRVARLGIDHPDTLQTDHNLALAYGRSGRLAESAALGEQTLARRAARLGPVNPSTLWTRTNLGSTYYLMGRAEESVRVHEEVMAAAAAGGKATADLVAANRYNLGREYAALGRPADALRVHPLDQGGVFPHAGVAALLTPPPGPAPLRLLAAAHTLGLRPPQAP